LFSILTSNTDDHLRNHGFLYDGPDGWRLSPAYDLDAHLLALRRSRAQGHDEVVRGQRRRGEEPRP
jgi:hypothetical protein